MMRFVLVLVFLISCTGYPSVACYYDHFDPETKRKALKNLVQKYGILSLWLDSYQSGLFLSSEPAKLASWLYPKYDALAKLQKLHRPLKKRKKQHEERLIEDIAKLRTQYRAAKKASLAKQPKFPWPGRISNPKHLAILYGLKKEKYQMLAQLPELPMDVQIKCDALASTYIKLEEDHESNPWTHELRMQLQKSKKDVKPSLAQYKRPKQVAKASKTSEEQEQIGLCSPKITKLHSKTESDTGGKGKPNETTPLLGPQSSGIKRSKQVSFRDFTGTDIYEGSDPTDDEVSRLTALLAEQYDHSTVSPGNILLQPENLAYSFLLLPAEDLASEDDNVLCYSSREIGEVDTSAHDEMSLGRVKELLTAEQFKEYETLVSLNIMSAETALTMLLGN